MPKNHVGSDPIDVAMAVIRKESQLLITQRKSDDSFGGLWEFPGGKLHPGETLEEALAREIQEELGIAITVGLKLKVIEHRYPNRTLRLHCFSCEILRGEPRAIECAAWRWVTAPELAQFRFPPASGPILDVLRGRTP